MRGIMHAKSSLPAPAAPVLFLLFACNGGEGKADANAAGDPVQEPAGDETAEVTGGG